MTLPAPDASVGRGQRGFTLVELMIVLAIIVVVASMGFPLYLRTVAAAEGTTAVEDLKRIALEIELFSASEGRLPDSLAEIGMDHMRDPWGQPYHYLRLADVEDLPVPKGKGKAPVGVKGGVGQARKDHNLVPINGDYDLYSSGPDGLSASPLTAESSQDDVIRAQDGDYYGVASDY